MEEDTTAFHSVAFSYADDDEDDKAADAERDNVKAEEDPDKKEVQLIKQEAFVPPFAIPQNIELVCLSCILCWYTCECTPS